MPRRCQTVAEFATVQRPNSRSKFTPKVTRAFLVSSFRAKARRHEIEQALALFIARYSAWFFVVLFLIGVRSGGFRRQPNPFWKISSSWDGADALRAVRSSISTLRKQGQSVLPVLETVFLGKPLYPNFDG